MPTLVQQFFAPFTNPDFPHIPYALIGLLAVAQFRLLWRCTSPDRRPPGLGTVALLLFTPSLLVIFWRATHTEFSAWALPMVLFGLSDLILAFRPVLHARRRHRDAARPIDPSFERGGIHHYEVLQAVRLGKHRTRDIVEHSRWRRRIVTQALKDLRDRAGLVTSPAPGWWQPADQRIRRVLDGVNPRSRPTSDVH